MKNRILSIIIGLLMVSSGAYAASQSIWGSTDRGPVVGTYRIPVDTSSSSSPGQISVTELQTFFNTLGVGTCIKGLTASSTGAAGANTTAIQTALTAGGTVSICSPGLYWINATLTIPSNTWFHGQPGTHIETMPNTNGPVLANATQSGSGNSWIFVDGIWFDGNQANQTAAFATVWMYFGDHYFFWNDRFDAALRLVSFPNGTFGEGIRLHNVTNSYVWSSDAELNVYDGFKVVGGSGNVLTNITATDNGRCGVQVGYDNYNGGGALLAQPTVGTINHRTTISNLTVNNTTATPSSVSPETCGVYFHGASDGTITNVTAINVNQLFGTGDSSSNNTFSNSTGYIVYDGTHAALSLEAVDSTYDNNYNTFTNIALQGTSGANGIFLRIGGVGANGNYNQFSNINLNRGAGTGTWTGIIGSGSTSNELDNILAPQGNFTLTDSGTTNVLNNVTGIGRGTGSVVVTPSSNIATIDTGAQNPNWFRIPLSHSATTTIAAPLHPYKGSKIVMELTQDSTGSNIVSWNSVFDFGVAAAPTLTTTANATDVVACGYSLALTKWLCTSALGF